MELHGPLHSASFRIFRMRNVSTDLVIFVIVISLKICLGHFWLYNYNIYNYKSVIYCTCIIQAIYCACIIQAIYCTCIIQAIYCTCIILAIYCTCIIQAIYYTCIIQAIYCTCIIQDIYCTWIIQALWNIRYKFNLVYNRHVS